MEFRPRDLAAYQHLAQHQYHSFEEFLSRDVHHGISRITAGGMHLDFLYEDKGAPVTFVYFHAALGLKQNYPFFGGRSMIEDLAVNYLGIADPVAGLSNAPTAGWHMGTRHMPLPDQLTELIEHVLTTGSGSHLVFFGASAGGFASLYYGSRFEDSLSVVVNPRTALLNPPHTFEEYRAIAYPDAAAEDLNRDICMETAPLYAAGGGNTVAYIQNLQDKRFLNGQLLPFLDQVPGHENIYLKTGEYGVGHVVPPRSVLRKALKSALKTAPRWGKGLRADGFQQAPSSTGLAKASRVSIKAALAASGKTA